MPRNPDKRRCAREGCKAWAMRGAESRASHSRSVAVGAPEGNLNALKHGFYARRGVPGDGDEVRTMPSIDDEITFLAARRDMLGRWVMAKIEAGEDVDVIKYVGLIAQTGSRIARMMRDREAIGSHTDPIADLFDEALDEVSDRWGIEL